MGEDILSVLFLALVCIVIAGLIYRMTPPDMFMPTFALIALCLWIAYDYIMLQRYKAKKACSVSKNKHVTNKKSRKEKDELDEKIKELKAIFDEDEQPKTKPHSLEKDPLENNPNEPQAKHSNEFDIAMYARELSVQELYKDMGCTGDTRMSNRMKYMGLQPRMSKDICARLNSEKLRPYFEEEMDDNEKAEWWNVENDYLDNFM